MEKLELLIERDGEKMRLCAPAVGTFTCAEPRGRVLVPGASAGVLEALGVARRLLVPAGVTGRVVSDVPDRVHAPVGYGDTLYELAPLAAGADEIDPSEADSGEGDGALVYRVPHSGRFWHRPAPQDPPFVTPGSLVGEGSTLGMIEVMKTFARLHYHVVGDLPAQARIVRLLADDGAEVNAGDAVIEVELAG